MKKEELRALCEGAVMVGLAVALNFVKLFQLPNGGSIDLAMIPIFMYSIRWGWRRGMASGFAFGLLQMFIDGAVAWGWQSLLLDYIVAFTPLGLCGLFKGKENGIFAGTVAGSFCRFAVHYVSGVTIYAILVPTELFRVTYTSPWLYSLVYNGSYMLVDTLLCLAVFAAVNKPMHMYIMGKDLRNT